MIRDYVVAVLTCVRYVLTAKLFSRVEPCLSLQNESVLDFVFGKIGKFKASRSLDRLSTHSIVRVTYGKEAELGTQLQGSSREIWPLIFFPCLLFGSGEVWRYSSCTHQLFVACCAISIPGRPVLQYAKSISLIGKNDGFHL